MRPVFSFQQYFPTLSYETAKQAYRAHFSDAALPNKSTVFRFVNRFNEIGATNYKRRSRVAQLV
jgi:hypothetical protein